MTGRNSFNERLSKINAEKMHTDVMFRCAVTKDAQANTVLIKAHKLILSIASDVFETMFFGKMAHQKNVEEKIIVIEDTTAPVFQMLIR